MKMMEVTKMIDNESELFKELGEKFDELFGSMNENDGIDDELEALDNIIVLNGEDGEETEFEFLDLIEYKNEEYIVLLPTDNEDEAGEVVILKIEDTGNSDEESYVSVEDDDTLQTVFEIFKEKFKDEFNFVD